MRQEQINQLKGMFSETDERFQKKVVNAIKVLAKDGKDFEWIQEALAYFPASYWERKGLGLLYTQRFRRQIDELFSGGDSWQSLLTDGEAQ